MMTTDSWEPVDYLAEFRERENDLCEVKELLEEKAHCEAGKLWAHHLPRMIDQVDFLRSLLREEIDHFGEWRYHEFQPDEVLEFIDEDLSELVQWLSRMTTSALPQDATEDRNLS